MKWVVDRIEGNVAVIDCNGQIFETDVSYLPQGVKENDIINVNIDVEETKKSEASAQERLNNLFKR